MTSTQTAPVNSATEPTREPPRSVQRLREIVARLADPDLPELDGDRDQAIELIRDLGVEPYESPSAVVPADQLRRPPVCDPAEQREATLAELVKVWGEVRRGDARLAEWDSAAFAFRRVAADQAVVDAQLALTKAQQVVHALDAEQAFQGMGVTGVQEQKGKYPVLFGDAFRGGR